MTNVTANTDIWFDERWGMNLHPGPHEKNDNENGILFLAEHFILKDKRGILTESDIQFFSKTVRRLETYNKEGTQRIIGLYDKAADDSINYSPRSVISVITHDNISAITAFSRHYNLPHAKEFNSWGMKNFFLLDNIQPWSPRMHRIQWPSDICIWMYSAKNPIWIPFYEILVFRTVLGMFSNSDTTSTKLLLFTKFYLLKDHGFFMNILWKIYRKKMILQYGKFWVHELMFRYFEDKTHPNIVMSAGLEF